jgi:hypothetical protein
MNEESIKKIYNELAPILKENDSFNPWNLIGSQKIKNKYNLRKNKTFLPQVELFLRPIILFSIVIALICYLLKENNITLFFIRVNNLFLLIYIVYRVSRFIVEYSLNSKDRDSLKASLEKSTLNHKMTDLENSFFPDIDSKEIEAITKNLSLHELFSLQIVELYLTRFNKIAEKNIMYFQRFYIFAIGFLISLVVFNDQGFKLFLINGFISSLILLEICLEKYSVLSKIGLSLHVLKEAQLIKAKRETIQ